MIRRTRRDDSGASLILVLIIVTVIALCLSALLFFSDTNLRATIALRDQAATVSAADAAMKSAINTLRAGTYTAAPGEQCFGGGNTLSLPLISGQDSAAVTCTGEAAKVLIHCPSVAQCNRPGAALLTLGRVPGEDGVRIEQPTTSVFRVHGTVFSNSTLNVVNGSLTTNAGVYARGACTGAVQSTPPPSCNYSAANALGDDPGYAPETSTAPPWRALPPCTTPSSVVAFEPGYYDDAKGLTDMMAGNSACRYSTWWFKPGVYYFDFHNAGADRNPLLKPSENVWTIDDGRLVAGTPSAPSGVPPVNVQIPGACDNPIDGVNAGGVQFIFGGDSRLAVKSGQAEICGTYSTSRPPVAVYGLTSGTAQTVTLTGTTTLKPTTVTDAGQFGTTTATTFADADGSVFGTWKFKKGDPATGTVTVGGFAPPAPIPAGSVLRSATAKVVHRHNDSAATDPVSVTVTPNGSTAVTGTATGQAGSSSWRTDAIPLDTAGTGSLAKAVNAGTFTGATIAVSVSTNSKASDNVDIDAIQLDLSYTPPALRAASGCVVATPYTASGSSACALINLVNNSGNQFYVQGTTYAPLGVVDLTLNNAAEQVFRFGTIARAVWIKETGSFAYTGPVIEVPDDTPGFGVSAYLNAYVCPKSTSCSATGTPALRSRVAMFDSDTGSPPVRRRKVAVLSWSTPG
ncbi:hypothetical protein [Lentzea nigeriaca]|uniref:hypothetical protein n=1 Tax=Lentzea nigeriaca TaxID=1128665 RepID=UPI0019599CA8|nr:hypothetical protein [Lentzea nigeriaca]MBM7865105.1 hypothetical protein [Lentzea nigeriaca]